MSGILKYLMPLLLFTAQVWSDDLRIAQHHGLDANNVSALMFDHQGFMWVGSQEGLFFYDGAQVEKFEPDSTNQTAISALDIRNLYQSRDSKIWISTNSGGLNLFDPKSRAFTQFRHDSNNPNTLTNDSVYDVVDGPDGHIWIATQIGLNRLDPISGAIKRFRTEDQGVGALPSNYVYKLYVDSKQRMWVGTIGGGLSYWSEAQQGFIPIALPGGNVDVFSIIEQPGGDLWVGTRHGLLRVNQHDLSVSTIELGGQESQAPMVISLYFHQNLLLIGTYAHGLKFYDPSTGRLLTQGLPVRDRKTITAMARNQAGQLFYATWGQGVHLLDTVPPRAQHVAPTQSFWHELPNVTAIEIQTTTNKVWVGSFSEGLHWVDLISNRLHKFESPDTHQQIKDVLSILSLPAEELLVGTATGLWHLNPQGQVVAFLQHHPGQANAIGAGFVRVLASDADGNIWLGLGGSGLYKYELKAKTLTSFRHHAEQATSISDDYITALLADGQYLWVGTRSNGLNRCVTKTMFCERFLVNHSGLTHYNITDIEKDPQGSIWIGTDGGGLHRVSREHENDASSVTIIAETNLAAKSIKSILVGPDHQLWFATHEGLFILKSVDRKFYRAKVSDMSALGNFNQRARGQSGNYGVLGCNNGVFFAGTPTIEAELKLPIRFTQITSDKLAKPLLNSQISDNYQLDVPWGGMLNVQFTLLDFSAAKHSYEYRVSSTDVWRKLNDVRQLSFYKMASGTHTLEVRGKTLGAQWSEPASITISVIPPWWRNTTYILFMLLFATILAICYHKYRMAKWRKITERLKNLKEEKSQVIAQLEQNEQQLRAAFDGMRKLASRLLNAKEEERKAISRELHDQFGQSLTAIQIGLQLYRRQHPVNSEPIESSVHNIQMMIKQVRAFSFDLRPSLLDDVGLTAATNDLITNLGKSVDYPIHFIADDNFPQVNSELSTTLFRVIQDSLTNAIKHAQATWIEVRLSFDGTKIRSVIRDNGIGFDVASIKEKISEGGHLGLLGVEERVHAQQGILTIDTQPGVGTLIAIEFLYEK